MFVKMRQILIAVAVNFRKWKKTPQVWFSFALGFIISFLLSDKVVVFAEEHDTVLQLLEPFIWTFGDANSILTISLCLLLLFADLPNLNKEVPLFLIRMDRKIWMAGQILYTALASFFFVSFIMVSTCLLTATRAYTGNLWSETAAVLGYSNIGKEIAVPAFVKVLELSFPYTCGIHIFGLMTGYSLLMSSIILYLNLCKRKGGMIGGILFSVFGFVVNPQVLAEWFHISEEQMNHANILFGWISPLNHATYYMHNFGYDNLPKLWVSYIGFLTGSLLVFGLALRKVKEYPFDFT